MAILGGLVHGVNWALGVTVVTFFLGWILISIVGKFKKTQATNIKKQEHEISHPYIASPEELPKALEITGLRRVDASLSHLCDWQGWAVTDRNMPDGKCGFDVIFKKSPEGWKAQTRYLGATLETLPTTWPERGYSPPLAAVQAELSSAWTNYKVMHELGQRFASMYPVPSPEHESPQAERKVMSGLEPNHENPAPIVDKKLDS